MPKLIIFEDRCKACGLCIHVCPKETLREMNSLNSIGYRPVELIDEERCNSCALCALVCPDLVFEVYK